MKTLFIETGLEEEYECLLINSAKKIGWEVVEICNVPFGDSFIYKTAGCRQESLSESDLNNEQGWYHGSIGGAVVAQKVTKWQVHAPWEQTSCSYYYKVLPDVILQKDYIFESIEGINTKKDFLFSSDLAENGSLFFRPNENSKIFSGCCINIENWEKDYKLLTFYDPPKDSVVVVSRPQNISSEARFLIVNNKLITGSCYKNSGKRIKITAGDYLMKEAQRVLDYCISKGFSPAPSWVLDLAKVKDEWKLIEVGPSSCCGLYRCDTDKFMSAIDNVI